MNKTYFICSLSKLIFLLINFPSQFKTIAELADKCFYREPLTKRQHDCKFAKVAWEIRQILFNSNHVLFSLIDHYLHAKFQKKPNEQSLRYLKTDEPGNRQACGWTGRPTDRPTRVIPKEPVG